MLRRSRILVVVVCLTGCGGFLGLTGDDSDDPDDAPNPAADASSIDGASGESSVGSGDGASRIDGAGGPDGKSDGASTIGDASKDTAADVPTLPAGCDGGVACTRYVFVTSAAYRGNLDEATANGKCQGLANATNAQNALKGRQWRAWLSGPAAPQDAKERMPVSTAPYRMVDGTQIAANTLALLNAANQPLEHAINVDEQGAMQTNVSVWTATNANGSRVSIGDCMGWTSMGNGAGVVGSTAAVDEQWTNAGSLTCSMDAHLYCFEY